VAAFASIVESSFLFTGNLQPANNLVQERKAKVDDDHANCERHEYKIDSGKWKHGAGREVRSSQLCLRVLLRRAAEDDCLSMGTLKMSEAEPVRAKSTFLSKSGQLIKTVAASVTSLKPPLPGCFLERMRGGLPA
jgi:hypothetical protein